MAGSGGEGPQRPPGDAARRRGTTAGGGSGRPRPSGQRRRPSPERTGGARHGDRQGQAPPSSGGPRRSGPPDPALPDDVTGSELDRPTAAQLNTLPKDLAQRVARHLVMTGRLVDEDPERALAHARAARRVASRVAVVREATGVAAYAAGEYAEALAELRAARRMAGTDDLLPMIADCERGLGRPGRALDLLSDPVVQGLDAGTRAELLVVGAGARRDLGQPEAAVLMLRGPATAATAQEAWAIRLRYAYADALLAVGREPEARQWFATVAAADSEGWTDAADRLARLEGLVFDDAWTGEVDTEEAGEDSHGGSGQ